MDFFRRFLFGIPWEDQFFNDSRRTPGTNDEDIFNRHGATDEPFPRRGFDVFSDPVQMHQYFEQEMNEVLKLFGFQGFGEFSFGIPNPPALEDLEPRSSNVRDQFLKRGYENPPQRSTDKVDKDLDDKILSGDLDSVLGSDLEKNITPYHKQTPGNFFHGTLTPYERETPQNFFYGKSQTMKTVVNPDGSTETHFTVRDNEGNEETSVCRKINDKEYCLVTKRDKSGKEEVTESFVNMDESEKDIFSKPRGDNLVTEEPSGSRFPFDKFFK